MVSGGWWLQRSKFKCVCVWVCVSVSVSVFLHDLMLSRNYVGQPMPAHL